MTSLQRATCSTPPSHLSLMEAFFADAPIAPGKKFYRVQL
jgi:hypothetical protein